MIYGIPKHSASVKKGALLGEGGRGGRGITRGIELFKGTHLIGLHTPSLGAGEGGEGVG